VESRSKAYDVMWDTYGDSIKDEEVKDFNILILGVEQYDVEEEMIEFAKSNPNATLQELWYYFFSITPDIEFVDDDEDEDDEDDED